MTQEKSSPNKACFNCETQLPTDAKFCHACGQKFTDGREKLGTIFSEFLSANFNLDSKLLRTLKGIFIPGFLTQQYFLGKQKSFTRPIQLFLVLSLILFSILSRKFDTVDTNSMNVRNIIETNIQKKMEYKEALIKYEKIKNNEIPLQTEQDTIQPILEKRRSTYALLFKNLEINQDSIIFSGKSFDLEKFLELKEYKNFVNENYPEATFVDRYVMTQSLRSGFDQKSMFKFLINKLPILILLTLPIVGLLFQLLYFRRKFYFVEHLLFLLHLLCFVQLLLIPSLIFLPKYAEISTSVIIVIGLLYSLFAIKRFYAQSWGKTILKFILAFVFGILAMIIALLLAFSITILIF